MREKKINSYVNFVREIFLHDLNILTCVESTNINRYETDADIHTQKKELIKIVKRILLSTFWLF